MKTKVRIMSNNRKKTGGNKKTPRRLYLITHTLTAYLQVYCNDEEEAREWGSRIVVGLEDENGKWIPPSAVYDFEADCYPGRMEIEFLEGDSA